MRGNGLANHARGAVDCEEAPVRKALSEFQHDLARAAADIEGGASAGGNGALEQAHRMFHEGIVDGFKIALCGGGRIGVHLRTVVHGLRFRDSREFEQRSEPAHGVLVGVELSRIAACCWKDRGKRGMYGASGL